MKYFISRLFLFGLVFWTVDKAFLVVRMNAASNEYDKRLEWVLEGKMNKDILIFGSSRGARSISAALLQDSLMQSTYNLSYLNSNIDFQTFLLEKLVAHNIPPKKIILVVDGQSTFRSYLVDP